MNLKRFRLKAEKVTEELKKAKSNNVLVIHHDDADGLCSAAITLRALEREGIKAETLCLEKLYTEVIEELHSKTGKTFFYVDIGSSHADLISKLNESRNLTVILDHHDPKPSKDPRVIDLNLENYGFKGETDFSGATCCYLFAETLNPENVDLSYLALVGSCEIPEGFFQVNRAVLEKALEKEVVQQKGKGFEVKKLKMRLDTLFSKLQILAAVGYYEGGPEIGIHACLEGLSAYAESKINMWEDRRKEVNRQVLARLYREKLKETMHTQWFDCGDMYRNMGTKVIGQFCSFLSYQKSLIKPDKYILLFVNVPREIPKWGELKETFVKASVRVPKTMQPMIDTGKLPGAVNLLQEASKGFGMADGHQYAANVVAPMEKKQLILESAEKALTLLKQNV